MAINVLLWWEFEVFQALIGYCFVIANASIGFYNIRDLNNMKGDITTVKMHKFNGRIETLFFYAILAQCITLMALRGITNAAFYDLSTDLGIHALIGGIVATALFTPKFYIAMFKKDTIYKYGKYLGPMGFTGWSLAFWTSLINYYFVAVPLRGAPTDFIPSSFIWSAIIPFPIGLCFFFGVLLRRGGTLKEKPFAVHQVAFILHGITFGYESAARELLGTPALLRYVVPKTSEFLEKLFQMVGFDLTKIKSMNANDALTEFAKRAAEIKMAEKVKIKWDSEKDFSVESVNCSTAKVRSVMSEDELKNAICPWAIMTASIAARVTGKDVEIDPSEFNQIGAKTKLHLVEKEQ